MVDTYTFVIAVCLEYHSSSKSLCNECVCLLSLILCNHSSLQAHASSSYIAVLNHTWFFLGLQTRLTLPCVCLSLCLELHPCNPAFAYPTPSPSLSLTWKASSWGKPSMVPKNLHLTRLNFPSTDTVPWISPLCSSWSSARCQSFLRDFSKLPEIRRCFCLVHCFTGLSLTCWLEQVLLETHSRYLLIEWRSDEWMNVWRTVPLSERKYSCNICTWLLR